MTTDPGSAGPGRGTPSAQVANVDCQAKTVYVPFVSTEGESFRIKDARSTGGRPGPKTV
jgi:hypothetical protein